MLFGMRLERRLLLLMEINNSGEEVVRKVKMEL